MSEMQNFDELYKELQDQHNEQTPETQPPKQEEENPLNSLLRSLVTVGTPMCGLVFALAGIVLAALLLSAGFWKTLMIAAFCAAGGWIGGVADKSQWLKDVINKLFPPKR